MNVSEPKHIGKIIKGILAPMKTTPESITELEPNQIFVFGSNLAGRHGAGAALTAMRRFGAKYGVGVGPTGQCYAIPTKDENFKTLPLSEIENHISRFLSCAKSHDHLEFLVTKIGCGLAGYEISDIAALFNNKYIPDNVVLPKEFLKK